MVSKKCYITDSIAVTGDEIQVVYVTGDDTTPVYANTAYYYTGFNGFRI